MMAVLKRSKLVRHLDGDKVRSYMVFRAHNVRKISWTDENIDPKISINTVDS